MDDWRESADSKMPTTRRAVDRNRPIADARRACARGRRIPTGCRPALAPPQGQRDWDKAREGPETLPRLSSDCNAVTSPRPILFEFPRFQRPALQSEFPGLG